MRNHLEVVSANNAVTKALDFVDSVTSGVLTHLRASVRLRPVVAVRREPVQTERSPCGIYGGQSGPVTGTPGCHCQLTPPMPDSLSSFTRRMDSGIVKARLHGSPRLINTVESMKLNSAIERYSLHGSTKVNEAVDFKMAANELVRDGVVVICD